MSAALPVWRVVKVGGLTKDKLLKKLAKLDRNVDIWTKDIMCRPEFTTSIEVRQVCFIRTTPRKLGFAGYPATTTQLFSRIVELGYQFCQPEDGPWLALQNLKKGDSFCVVTEPIAGVGGDSRMFYIYREDGDDLFPDPWSGDGNLFLDAHRIDSDHSWHPDSCIVLRSGNNK